MSVQKQINDAVFNYGSRLEYRQLISAIMDIIPKWTKVDAGLPKEITIAGIDNTQWYLVEYQQLGALNVKIAWYGRTLEESDKEIGFRFPNGKLQTGSIIRQWMAYSPPKLPSSLDKDANYVWGLEITPPED